jgi:clan AA aspartic protease
MIVGRVERAREALIDLSLHEPGGGTLFIMAAIDTGFDGYLTLPPDLIQALAAPLIGIGRAILADGRPTLLPVHEVTLDWDGRPLTIEANAAVTTPLVGMLLMRGYELRIQVSDPGRVQLERL